jgi:2-polyprenyl-3-methyl-5-hydroxy-6-metoxy-1,4-benzoquinol methylase
MNPWLLRNIPDFEPLNDSVLNRSLVTYVNEVKFAIEVLFDDLNSLDSKSKLLEIGSGIGLLSNQIARSGISVTSLEPSGEGFETMQQLQRIVSSHPDFQSINNMKMVESKFESFETNDRFDYIFCFNVLEHVEQPKEFIAHALSLLSEKGVFRFVCPNYKFPYEGHFNIPIVINKNITRRVFSKRISGLGVENAHGLWESLNWITFDKVSEILKSYEAFGTVYLSRKTFSAYLLRIGYDEVFVQRKGVLIQKLVPLIRGLFRYVPLKFIPVIDMRISKDRRGQND